MNYFSNVLDGAFHFYQRLQQAYRLGEEDSMLAGNRFWFGHLLTSDHKDHVHPVEYWDFRRSQIGGQKTRLSLLERIAFELGSETDFAVLPPQEPHLVKVQ